ncbi:uncharacterized protein LOC136027465 isoform X2 [Artemia franciscana]
MNIIELVNDFEEKVLMFCRSIDEKFGKKQGSYGAQAREEEADSENDETEDQGSSVKKSTKENILTMPNVIVILWLVLRRDSEHNLPILKSDLIRWFRELHIFVPEPNLVSGPTSYTIHGRSRFFFCSAYLNVDVLSPLDVRAIIKRTLIDLELPGTFGKYVWGYYRKHYRQPANEVVPPRVTRGMVEHELRLAASILAVMKLFWGLNGYCEKKLDSLAKTLNQIYRDDSRWQPLFEFQEWIEYIEWRSSVLKSIYHPAQIRDENFATATDASPFYHYQKMYKKKLAEFQGQTFSEEEYFKSDGAYNPAFEFSPSITAFHTKDKEFRQRYASLTKSEKESLKISMKPVPVSRSRSLRHVLDPDVFVNEMSRRNVKVERASGLVGKIYFTKQLLPIEVDFSRHRPTLNFSSLYFETPGRTLCDLTEASPHESDNLEDDPERLLLPVACQPLALYEVSPSGYKGINVWLRYVRHQIPHSLAVLVETLAELFEISEMELMSEVYSLEKKYKPDDVLKLV